MDADIDERGDAVDDLPISDAPCKPMTPAEALADPVSFVAGMQETKIYSIFVPIPPNVLRAMLGQTADVIEAYTLFDTSGSIVHTTSEDRLKQFKARWHRVG